MEIISIILSLLALGVSGWLAYHVYNNRVTDKTVTDITKRQEEINNILNNYELKSKRK